MKPRAFISYRREDSQPTASALYRDLLDRFSQEQIFLDHQRIEGGADWSESLKQELEAATVVFVLVGPSWLSARDPNTHQRRLDLANDWVRLEIEAALEGNKVVVPLLVKGQGPPKDQQLGTGGAADLIRSLFSRQVMKLRDEDWSPDVGKLVALLEQQGFRRRPPEPPRTAPVEERESAPERARTSPEKDREPAPERARTSPEKEREPPRPAPAADWRKGVRDWLRANWTLPAIGLFLGVVFGYANWFAIPEMERVQRLAEGATRDFVKHLAGYQAAPIAAAIESPFFFGGDRFESAAEVEAHFDRLFVYARDNSEAQSDSRSMRATVELAQWLANQQAKENTDVLGALELRTKVDLGSEKEEDRGTIPAPPWPLEDDAARVSLRLRGFTSQRLDVVYLFYSLRGDGVTLRGILVRKQ